MLSTCTTPLMWAHRHRDVGPVQVATVEIWQCDALGRSSGFPPPESSTMVTSATAPRGEYLPDQTSYAAANSTDAAGMVEFRAIYAGWYPGRTVHIHWSTPRTPRTRCPRRPDRVGRELSADHGDALYRAATARPSAGSCRRARRRR
jgi:hypothetical protein